MVDTLPEEVRRAWLRLPRARQEEIMELRFRIGRPVSLVRAWGEEQLRGESGGILVTDKLLKELYDRATGFSPYSLKTEETGLYLPLKGGCRMGICGEAAIRDRKFLGLSHISSINIRLARECRGIGKGLSARITASGRVESCLILSPPGFGKTSLLRDLIRCVSEMGYRVSVSDERRELAAAEKGIPQLDVGPCTDVLSGLHKTESVPLLLRAMNPQVLGLDELSGAEELALIKEAAVSGVAVLATVHAGNLAELLKKQGFGEMLREGLFPWVVIIGKNHQITIERLESNAEICGSRIGGRCFPGDGTCGREHPPPPDSNIAAASACYGADGRGNGTEYAAGF